MTKFEDIKVSKVLPFILNGSFHGESLILSMIKKSAINCPLVAGDNELMETLSKIDFDLMIVDAGFAEVCLSVIAYKLSIPRILLERKFQLQNMRMLIHPAAYSVPVGFQLTDRMTYIQRFANTIMFMLLYIVPDPVNPADIVGTFATYLPHITNEQMKAKTALYLLDTDELIDYHLPKYPKVIYVGGVATRPACPLTGNLKAFLASAVDGTVLVSFETVVNKFPNDLIKKLFGVFKKNPYLKFIFRFGNETKIDGNVMRMSWLPQNDVLAHPNIQLFIFHCGNNGQYEALYHGVPIIGMPVFCDQPYNAARIQAKGVGIYLNVVDFTIKDLDMAINELFSNTMYNKNIMKASKVYRSRYFTPSQRAAWWIDHVVTFGSQHLHSAIFDLPYYQFLMLDVWVGLVGLLFLVCFSTYLFLKCSSQILCKPKMDTMYKLLVYWKPLNGSFGKQ